MLTVNPLPFRYRDMIGIQGRGPRGNMRPRMRHAAARFHSLIDYKYTQKLVINRLAAVGKVNCTLCQSILYSNNIITTKRYHDIH